MVTEQQTIMASSSMSDHLALVTEALRLLPSRQELQVDSPRTADVKKYCQEVVETVQVRLNNGNHALFAVFSERLVSLLRSPLEVSTPTTMSKRREIMWAEYAKLRVEKLPKLWKEFINIGCSHVFREPLLMEIANEALFEKLIEEMFSTEAEDSVESVSLTKDEENILRYACGYVGMKLHQHFLKLPGDKAAQYVECLYNMQSDGPTSSLLDYTKCWIEKVNRGGLFDVSDEAYQLFRAIEMAMRNKLTNHLMKQTSAIPQDSDEGKSAIIEFVLHDLDVQFYWSMIDTDIEDEGHSSELLRHIVQLWLTIRGFSISKAWIEDYKCALSTTASKTKSLRKGLKRKQKTPPTE